MGRHSRLTVFTIALAVTGMAVTVAQPSSAHAQPADPVQAKEKYDEGKAAWAERDFEAAIAAFEQSYALDPKPKVLFSLARCYEELAQLERAVEYFDQYLAAPHNDAVAEEARVRKLALERTLELENKEKPDPGDNGHNKVVDVTPDPGEKLRYWGYISAGTGLGLVITSAYFSIKASNLEGQIKPENGMWTDDVLDKYDQGKFNEKLAIGTGIVGVAAVAAGATLLYLGFTREAPTTVVVPNEGGGATVMTTLTF